MRHLCIGALLSAFLLSGCEQVSPIADKSPGVYKGALDPLTSASADERAKKLAERFSLVQNRQ